MKQNDFILNTEFLSIAKVGRHEYTVVVPAGTVPAGGQVTKTYNFGIPAQKGAMDQMMIRQDSGGFLIGHSYSVKNGNNTIGVLRADRTTASNLHVEVSINNLFSQSSLSYPEMTFTLIINIFKSPNIL